MWVVSHDTHAVRTIARCPTLRLCLPNYSQFSSSSLADQYSPNGPRYCRIVARPVHDLVKEKLQLRLNVPLEHAMVPKLRSIFVNPNVHTVGERKLITSPSPSPSKIKGTHRNHNPLAVVARPAIPLADFVTDINGDRNEREATAARLLSPVTRSDRTSESERTELKSGGWGSIGGVRRMRRVGGSIWQLDQWPSGRERREKRRPARRLIFFFAIRVFFFVRCSMRCDGPVARFRVLS